MKRIIPLILTLLVGLTTFGCQNSFAPTPLSQGYEIGSVTSQKFGVPLSLHLAQDTTENTNNYYTVSVYVKAGHPGYHIARDSRHSIMLRNTRTNDAEVVSFYSEFKKDGRTFAVSDIAMN